MPRVNWIDVSRLDFHVLLLLERVQLSWFPGWVQETDLAIALRANPAVEWYLRHKCPELNRWLDQVMAKASENPPSDAASIRQAEFAVMGTINDLLTYVVDPTIYDAQSFLNWDSNELSDLVDFTGKTVIDVGAGTGRLTMIAAPSAYAVFAVEPVANLRFYLSQKAIDMGLRNVNTVDGLITNIPFPGGFADVTMGGHVFGDHPVEEYREMTRVTKPGGIIILCPGCNDRDSDQRHRFLVSQGCRWSRFEEPGDGIKRKYWKTV